MKTTRFRRISRVCCMILLSAFSLPFEANRVLAESPGVPLRPDQSAELKTVAMLDGQATIRVVHVKYANVLTLSHLIGPLGVNATADSSLRVIAIEGTPALVAAAEAAIKQLDVPAPPSHDVAINGYLLMAKRRTATENNVVPGGLVLPDVAGTNVPAQLERVITQLKQELNYSDIIVIDTLTLRTVDGGQASVSGLAPICRAYAYRPPDPNKLTLGENEQAVVDFRVIGGASILRGKGAPSVSLRGLQLVVTKAYSHDPPGSISTDIDVGHNQQVVVGKTNVLSPDLALFLVIAVQIID